MTGVWLTHVRDNPMEGRSLVTKAMLAGGELAKILGCFWDGFVI